LPQNIFRRGCAKRVFALDVPAIHVLLARRKNVDARDKPGHDEFHVGVWYATTGSVTYRFPLRLRND